MRGLFARASTVLAFVGVVGLVSPASARPLSPTARQAQVMAYMDKNGFRHVYMFGGGDANGDPVPADTWYWNTSTGVWVQPSVGTMPCGRVSARMVYASNISKLVMFGGRGWPGTSNCSGTTQQLSETWEFDGSTWSSVTCGGMNCHPSTREGEQLAYDRNTGKVILFGGLHGSQRPQDTWEFDPAGGTWTQVSPTASPPGRNAGASAWDAHAGTNGDVMIYGGNTGGTSYKDDAWYYTPGSPPTWTKICEPCTGIATTGIRADWFPTASRVALFGGVSANPQTFYNTVWYEDAANVPAFVAQSPSGTPPKERTSAGWAFDGVSQGVLMFGGGTKLTGACSDTWGYSGSSWVLLDGTSCS
jgi:hypothetical protein